MQTDVVDADTCTPRPAAAARCRRVVQYLQQVMQHVGEWTGEASGTFDDALETAVMRPQDANGLMQTGVVDADMGSLLDRLQHQAAAPATPAHRSVADMRRPAGVRRRRHDPGRSGHRAGPHGRRQEQGEASVHLRPGSREAEAAVQKFEAENP
jgi:peptidoglycan hydrolase-like protein with peptidoglycan-binding domain